MENPKLNIFFRLLDICLHPVMYLLQGNFIEKPQETHPWHVKKYKWKGRGIKIKGNDDLAKYSQSGISKYLGLYHAPILGGLRKYVVLEDSKFKKFWNVGWDGHIQVLRIYEPRIKLLVGKEGYNAHGLSDDRNEVKLSIIDFGKIGDGKYKNIRLF